MRNDLLDSDIHLRYLGIVILEYQTQDVWTHELTLFILLLFHTLMLNLDGRMQHMVQLTGFRPHGAIPYLQPLALLPPAWNFPQYTQRDSRGYPMKGH